ncbi:Crp/Fnr family transcriptional regulator [Ruminococcaceae bacterium OttesenSCG-928-L11]|nr:Crp/Fnr family transcriptional regulator [Ruminococcaceae bacterium OttesenSCG-928-L11]
MHSFFETIKKCPLFADIQDSDLESLLRCLAATRHTYSRDAFVFHADDAVESVGVVLAGSVHILQEDFWGNRTILAHGGEGDLFGEAFSCAGAERLPVSVMAVEPAEILLINYRKIITTCPNSCGFHVTLIRNMLHILARKNMMLTQKLEVLSMRTTRDKLLAYLSARAVAEQSNRIVIPFSRQELADYLCVDRSALSRELGKMQREGLLRYDKSRFELMQQSMQ